MRSIPGIVLAVIFHFLPPAAAAADVAAGQAAYEAGDYPTAIAEWQPLAEAGNADAQFGMGLLYGNGFGVPMDDVLALKWYGLAADQDHAQAQCNLAVMYANGWGVPQDDEEAFRWYGLAAEGGVLQAQLSLAKMYASSTRGTPDRVHAYQWLAIAAERGDYDATLKRDELATAMSADEVAEGSRLATDWMASHPNLLARE